MGCDIAALFDHHISIYFLDAVTDFKGALFDHHISIYFLDAVTDLEEQLFHLQFSQTTHNAICLLFQSHNHTQFLLMHGTAGRAGYNRWLLQLVIQDIKLNILSEKVSGI